MDEIESTEPEATAEENKAPSLEAYARKWKTQLSASKKGLSRFHTRAQKVVDSYMLQERHGDTINEMGVSRYPIFWSNVQTMRPALYSRTPKPQAERKFKDQDQLGRVAAQILERAADSAVDSKDFDPVMKRSVFDLLVPGLAVARVRYKPHFETRFVPVVVPPEMVEAGQVPEEYRETLTFNGAEWSYLREEERLVYEEVIPEHVHYKDFMFEVAKTWEDVTWVAFKYYMTREEVVERWGEDAVDCCTFDSGDETLKELYETSSMSADTFKKTLVYEIWDKRKREVVWLPKGSTKALEVSEDPYNLEDFFPCPRPMFGPQSTDNIIPAPEYTFYQDMAAEVDSLTARIDILTDSLRVAGVYDAQFEEVKNVLNNDQLIPVQDYTQFMQQGGWSGVMQLIPMGELVSVLQTMIQLRQTLIEAIYQVTGMSDIMRGNSDPRETAKAQQIKGQFASIRLSERQEDVQRFARDLIRLMSEIIAEKFQPRTIAIISGYEQLPDNEVQLFQEAVKLLRSDLHRNFRIDIETDSTLSIDQDMEKAQATEFIQALTGFLGTAQQVGAASPAMVPLLGQVLLFGVRRFHVGRNMESAIEDTINQLVQQSQQPPPEPAPDPEMYKLQLKQQEMQMEMEMKHRELQLEMSKTLAEIEKIRAQTISERQRGESEALKDAAQAAKASVEAEAARVPRVIPPPVFG